MNIPSYATCSMCKGWVESDQGWEKGTCKYAEKQALEGMVQAGITPHGVRVEISHNAKPCSEWEESERGAKDILDYEEEVRALDRDERRGAI